MVVGLMLVPLKITGYTFPTPEAEFLNHINYVRSTVGEEFLTEDLGLQAYAESWAITMAHSGFGHSDIEQLLGPFGIVGENVGYGHSPSQITTALYYSPSHRANMTEGRYTRLGIGVYVDSNGAMWTAHVFGGQ